MFLEAALLVHITLILEVNLNKPVSFAILASTVLDLTLQLPQEIVMPDTIALLDLTCLSRRKRDLATIQRMELMKKRNAI